MKKNSVRRKKHIYLQKKVMIIFLTSSHLKIANCVKRIVMTFFWKRNRIVFHEKKNQPNQIFNSLSSLWVFSWHTLAHFHSFHCKVILTAVQIPPCFSKKWFWYCVLISSNLKHNNVDILWGDSWLLMSKTSYWDCLLTGYLHSSMVHW